jgi:hypothetical protein
MLIAGGYQAAASPTAPTAPATVVSHCTYAALKSAVAHGGTITFGCGGTIVFGGELTVSGGRVTIDGQGQKVDFASDGNGRLFMVTGGHLTIDHLTL